MADSLLVQRLLDDRVDIVGDVHGEAASLRSLLAGLGCDLERARVERPIVFVGDLIDRGPDSVAVVEIVEHLVRSGVAQMVLGNHEFNLLRGDRKEGNGWFFPSDDHVDGWHDGHARVPFNSRSATTAEQERIRAFLMDLPLALESDTLRVVHAAWSPESLRSVRQAASLHEALFDDSSPESNRIQERFHDAPTADQIADPTVQLAYHAALAEAQAEAQNANAAKLLTSGPERPIGAGALPRYLSGKWRFVERDRWWEHDDDARPVVFGHYWRRRAHGGVPFKAAVFEGIAPDAWFGRHHHAFCIDYSVGYRFRARHFGVDGNRDFALAALRMPERTLRFDDGDSWSATSHVR
jgi:hypothetical protein